MIILVAELTADRCLVLRRPQVTCSNVASIIDNIQNDEESEGDNGDVLLVDTVNEID